MSIEIVPINKSHIEGFHTCVDMVAKERKYLATTQAPSLDCVRAFVENNIAENKPQFVAVDGDRVVGWSDFIRKERPISRHVGVLGMGVLPDYRSKGIGRRLLQTVIQEAFQQEMIRIELLVHASNLVAIGLYEKMGFRMEGTMKDDIFIDGSFDSPHCMALFAEGFEQQTLA